MAPVLAFQADFAGNGLFWILEGVDQGGPFQIEEHFKGHFPHLEGIVAGEPAELDVGEGESLVHHHQGAFTGGLHQCSVFLPGPAKLFFRISPPVFYAETLPDNK